MDKNSDSDRVQSSSSQDSDPENPRDESITQNKHEDEQTMRTAPTVLAPQASKSQSKGEAGRDPSSIPSPDVLIPEAASVTTHNSGVESAKTPILQRLWLALSWGPEATRYNPEKPLKFSLGLNVLFAIATTVTVANIYYNQPILNKMAESFNVSFERAASVATLMQAGYAGGLLFLCPLGDVLERRPFILGLVMLTILFWLGLCIAKSFEVFQAMSFLCGFTTVTPQLMLPLVGDLAPPNRRASSLSVAVAGLSLGMMVARVLSGIVSNFTEWRNIYWVALGLQLALLAALWLHLPNYPSKNPGGLNYFGMLLNIFTLIASEAVLLQACLISFCISAVFTSYWTTLSFLLSSAPYNFGPLQIGLFGLIGFFVVFWGPAFGRLVLDKLVALVPAICGIMINLVGVTIGTFTGTFTLAGPIVQAIFIDVSNQTCNTALRMAIFNIDPKARNRVNVAYMIAAFCGQLTGTAVGNRLYAQGGWRWSGSCSMGFLGFAILVCLARGPRETGWVGWTGGWSPRVERREKASPVPNQQQTSPELSESPEAKV
ncbi:hypothetical protein PgNI_05893 [Pyricularia grisea]|uniref:Major facilitator superfamily (MFS) profile domain-containing protein n=1 Tax=Pyricularia grisea TaxID=148305 RepID=A0A6P8B6N6_PYRGI|nr:hypothetical protein PgNI_05893 [Pyricularia grisea]TLD10930.1 hypothetical protein PgNI_05893 [Pyricularia grisea]